MSAVESIIRNVLVALYQPFWAAFVFSIFVMFFSYMPTASLIMKCLSWYVVGGKCKI